MRRLLALVLPFTAACYAERLTGPQTTELQASRGSSRFIGCRVPYSRPANFLLVVDGELVAPGDSVGVRRWLAGADPAAIDQIVVMKPDVAQARFGVPGRHGALLITMKRQGSE